MHQIEHKALQKYEHNLQYFQENHPDLHKKLSLLDKAITNGFYQENFVLEYKDGYFDVKELNTENYLYGQNSIEYSKKISKNMNFKKSDHVIETFYNRSFPSSVVQRYDQKPVILDPLYASAKIIHYANSIKTKNDEMKKITKFIFAGVGLGIHIPLIQARTASKKIFIIDDNLELFRFSLFVINYYAISQETDCSFSIMDNDKVLQNIFDDFFSSGYNNNHYLKYTLFSNNNLALIKRLQHFIVSSSRLTFPYSSHLKELIKAPEYLIQKYPFLDVSKTYKSSPLSNKPILLLAPGPSLTKHQKWLQKNKDKFIIISVLTAAKTLQKLDIIPDIMIHIDSQSLSKSIYKNLDIKKIFHKTIFIFSSVVSQDIIDPLNKEKIYFFESASNYKQNFGRLTFPSVGESSYVLSLILGAQKLYLLGIDMALDPATMKSHTDEHTTSSYKIKEGLGEEYTTLRDTISYVKGNLSQSVPTTSLFKLSISAFSKCVELYLKNQKVYNLSDGAYLEGTIPLDEKNIDYSSFDPLNKEIVQQDIMKFLNDISQKGLNEKDHTYLDMQITEAEALLHMLEVFKKEVSTTSYVFYMKEFQKLTARLTNEGNESKDINIILNYYLRYTLTYIFDIFNTKGLSNQKRHLKKINKIFIEQVSKIITLYLTTMKIYKDFSHA